MQRAGAEPIVDVSATLDASAAQFSVPASVSLQERGLTMKQGDMFAVFDHNGDIRRGGSRRASSIATPATSRISIWR